MVVDVTYYVVVDVTYYVVVDITYYVLVDVIRGDKHLMRIPPRPHYIAPTPLEAATTST